MLRDLLYWLIPVQGTTAVKCLRQFFVLIRKIYSRCSRNLSKDIKISGRVKIYFHLSQINEFLRYLNVLHLNKMAPTDLSVSRFKIHFFSEVRNILVCQQDAGTVSNFKQ